VLRQNPQSDCLRVTVNVKKNGFLSRFQTMWISNNAIYSIRCIAHCRFSCFTITWTGREVDGPIAGFASGLVDAHAGG
jgi:hypothetical protein